ncbi:MAG TPA: polysaccharide lyase family protein [Opitutaceae bacterium]|nr:polysaccharide lyase family protein [Opitutaceae bacterium]
MSSSLFHPIRRRILLACAAIAGLFLAASVFPAEAPPVVAPTTTNEPVTLREDADAFTLANGIVTARIDKRTSDLVSLRYHGIETMGAGGYWEQRPFGGTTRVTIDPSQNGGERAEISIQRVTGGHGLDLEVRYALARGLSGIYVYGIYTHPASYGAMGEGESRYITKLNQTFNWISVDADRNMLECTPQDWGAGIVIHAKEQRILTTGYYRNSVEHKYSYNAVQYRLPAYGWSSTKDHVGVWFINPSTEYLSGGSERLDLVCHYDANNNPDPIILDYWCSGHYAGGTSCRVPAGEAWNKVIGPIFVYCNALRSAQTPSAADLATLAATAGNPTVPPAWQANANALFDDALAQAQVQRAQWPFDWVNGVDYPHRNERGTVTGRLVLDDPQAASSSLPHLTIGLAHPDYPGGSPRGGNHGIVTWAHDGNYYQFWTDGTADGRFTIRNVRPGTYTLHAFADGVLGEYARANVTVEAGQTLDLGSLDWRPIRFGKQVWDIGYPDRTGDKFFKGDGANYWLWGWGLRYPLLFPNDITYTIGKSDYHRDWFFQQVPHSENTEWINPAAKDPANQRFGWMNLPPTARNWWPVIGHGRATTWTIKFDLDHAPRGEACLRVALAGSDGNFGPGGGGGLEVGLNGGAVGVIRTISTNALRYNSNKSVWREYALKFDAAKLRAGENQMTLTVPAGDLTSGVVYDYLRLELDEHANPSGTSVSYAN